MLRDLSGWSFTFPGFCYNQGGVFLPDFLCASAMSHAQTNQNTGASSPLVSDRVLIWMYTANAATMSKSEAFASLSAW